MAFAYRVRYRITNPPGEGERVLFQLPIRIGRNALNDCPIPHPYVSDFHAVIEMSEGRLCIRDLRSKNGIQTPAGERMPADRPVPLAATQFAFVLGRAIQVRVEQGEQSLPTGGRASGAAGTVLGNRAVLHDGIRQHDAPTGPAAPPDVADGALPPAPAPWTGGSAPAYPLPNAIAPAQPVGPAVREPSHRDALATAHLSLQPETLALQGLRELAASLVGGPPLETTGDIARLITKLHDTVEVFCRCFVPLREGYSKFVSSFDLRRAASQAGLRRSPSALRVEAAADPASVAAALLDWRNSDFDTPEAVAGIFADLMAHQIALVEGVMQGVQAFFEELSPESIENAARAEPHGLSGVLGRYRLLWQTFRTRYEELATETRKFELVFGSEFATAYRDYIARQQRKPY